MGHYPRPQRDKAIKKGMNEVMRITGQSRKVLEGNPALLVESVVCSVAMENNPRARKHFLAGLRGLPLEKGYAFAEAYRNSSIKRYLEPVYEELHEKMDQRGKLEKTDSRYVRSGKDEFSNRVAEELLNQDPFIDALYALFPGGFGDKAE